MNNQQIIPAGIDIGFGDDKAAAVIDGKLQTISFPSVLGHAQQLSNFTTGLGRVTRRRATRIEYNGVEYYVGDDALKYSRTQAGRQDSGRIGSDEERILALVALARLGITHANVVTGLPVIWFDEGRRRIRKSFKGEHTLTLNKKTVTITIHNVIVLPQPLGGFFSHVLDQSGRATMPGDEMERTYACLDVGWNTTDMTVIKKLVPEDQWQGGAKIGVNSVIQIIRDEIRRRFGADFKPHEVEQIIHDGRIEIEGEYHDMAGIIKSATSSLSDQIKSTATEMWDRHRLSFVLAFGGGGAIFWPAIHEAFPKNSILLPRPGLANAIGFACYAQRNIWSNGNGQ